MASHFEFQNFSLDCLLLRRLLRTPLKEQKKINKSNFNLKMRVVYNLTLIYWKNLYNGFLDLSNWHLEILGFITWEPKCSFQLDFNANWLKSISWINYILDICFNLEVVFSAWMKAILQQILLITSVSIQYFIIKFDWSSTELWIKWIMNTLILCLWNITYLYLRKRKILANLSIRTTVIFI